MPSQNFTNNGSISIPANAKNVKVDLAAGRGGKGGPDAGGSAGNGGGGRRANIYFSDFIARTLTFTIGKQGGEGGGCSSNAPGGGGGSGYRSGGTGGRAGPSGCSGGGGGGGGASSIYDSYAGGIVAVCGGGGGGGGTSLNASGENGRVGYGMLTGALVSPSNGSNGSNCPNDGAGGGGGGGGVGGGSGGAEGYDNNYGGRKGEGGLSAYNSSYCSFNYNTGSSNQGNGFANVSYDLQNPSITSFSITPSAIIRGESAELNWTTNFASSCDIDQGVGSVNVNSNPVTVSPNNTTDYTLTASFGGVSVTSTRTLTVYIPPVLNVYASASAIIAGQSVTISWDHTGDGDTVVWTSGDPPITNGNTNSFTNPAITLFDSTTYCAYITGLGGTSSTVCVTVTVYQIPTISTFDTPSVINYGDTSLLIEYESQYANIEQKVEIVGVRATGPDAGQVLEETILLPVAGSAEASGPNTIVQGQYSWTPTWDDHGPRSYSITYTATGDGGSISSGPNIVTVNIDETPDNLDIPPSDELIKDAEPVISPDTEIVSEKLLVDDIDIPVEIKSNYPIQVQINNDTDWDLVREL